MSGSSPCAACRREHGPVECAADRRGSSEAMGEAASDKERSLCLRFQRALAATETDRFHSSLDSLSPSATDAVAREPI